MDDLGQFLDPAQIGDMVIGFVPKLIAAGLVLFAFWVILRITRPALRGLLQKADFENALIQLLVDQVFRTVVWAVALVMAVSQLGVDVGAMIAGLGVAGLAIGFAAKDSLQNTIAGFLIFWDKPFKVGDFITTQSQYGEVTNITMRTTRIRTPNNTYVVIPNSQIIEDALVNHSIHGDTRVVVPVGISYGSDIDRAREVLLEAAGSVQGVLSDPAPTVVVTELADSSVNLAVRVWIEDAQQERAAFQRTLEACKKALDKAGIEIPFPHLQLYLDGVKDGVWERAAELQLVDAGTVKAS